MAQLITIGVQVMKVPLLYHYLGSRRDGWYLLISLIGYATMMEFGLVLTAARFIGRAFGKLRDDPESPLAREQFIEVVAVTKFLFWLAALAVSLLGSGVGSVYIYTLQIPVEEHRLLAISFSVLAISSGFSIFADQYGILLDSVGKMGLQSVAKAICSGLGLLTSYILLLLDFGFAAAVVGEVLRTVLHLFWVRWMMRRLSLPLDHLSIRPAWRGAMARQLMAGQYYTFLANAGITAMSSMDGVLIGSLLSTKSMANYYNTQSVVNLVAGQASMLLSITVTFMFQSVGADRPEETRRLLNFNLRFGLLLLGFLLGGIWLFCEPLIAWWIGSGNFVGHKLVALFVMSAIITYHGSIWLFMILARERMKYWKVTWAAGLLRAAVGYFAIRQFGWGLFGVVGSKIAGESLIYLIYAPIVGFRLLQRPLVASLVRRHLMTDYLPMAGCLSWSLLLWWMTGGPRGISFGTAVLLAGYLFGAGLLVWISLDHMHRQIFINRMSREFRRFSQRQ